MASGLPLMVLLQWYLSGTPGPAGLVTALLPATAAGALALWLTLRHALALGERPLPLYASSFVASVAAVWILLPGAAALVVPTVWWGMTTPAVPRRWSAPTGVVLLALPWAHAALAGAPTPSPLWFPVMLVLAGVMLTGHRMNLRMWELSREVVAGRHVRERLAASEERLRIARDIHDLLGHRLSGIAVRSELAARLAEATPERAAHEMRIVQDEARRALREVRSTVSGYRDVDPAEELEGAREVLAAAGVHLTVTGDPRDIPAPLRTTAAWVVREAVTNVVRHSEARHCEITLDADGAFTLQVVNDGAPAHRGSGSGLLGLTQRVAAEGGTLEAGAEDGGRFRLSVVVPRAEVAR
ncbi:sensor histidine kinase [Nocardiopsis sp. MG754419]|nr:sensor histidine kinase [Nocardiopsis sp. MG754419]